MGGDRSQGGAEIFKLDCKDDRSFSYAFVAVESMRQ